MLKFLIAYLSGREQRVVIENKLSLWLPVHSGVPQGSILGPILFVIFINDLPEGLTPGTDLALYADDTKIWRSIKAESDHLALQNDIAYLNSWSNNNKLHFNIGKCKVLSVANRPNPLLGILPHIQFWYFLGENLLEYTDHEKDLGVNVNTKLNWSDHCNKIYSKANQMLGLTRRTCHFICDEKRKRALYLTLVRSQFEHCSVIWHPTGKTLLQKLETIQKRAIKWILSEEYSSYSSHSTYIHKCRQTNLLPISEKFVLNDLILFHKAVYNYISLELPYYLNFFNGSTRLRSSHLDELSIVSCVEPRTNPYNFDSNNNRNTFANSFFYRTHILWNQLPFDVRKIACTKTFKKDLVDYLWKSLLHDNNSSDEDDLIDFG